ncbi:hypothetical protein SSX86_031434, partial [Deinandra increscens subsp. villosa]
LKAIEDLVVADSVEQLPNDKDDIEKISKKPLTPLKRLKLKKKTSPSKHQQTFEIKYRKEPNKDPKESKKLESEVEVTENDDGSMLLKDLKDDKKTPQKLVVKFKKVIQESEKDMKIGPTSEHLLSETPVHIPLKKITKSLESNKNGKNESKSKVQVKGASSVKKGTRRSWRIALNTSFSKYTNDIRNPDKIDSDDDDQASKGKTVKGEVQKKRAPKIVMEERKSDDDFEDPKNEKNVKNKTQKEVQKSNSDDDFQVSNREKKVKEETAKVVKKRKKVIPNRKVSKKSLPKKNLKKKSETEPVSEFENEAKPYVPYNGDRIPCRTKIKHFIEMVEGLNEEQKSEIRRIGFGSVLSFNIEHVPTGLGQWLVNNYDENNNTLNIGSCKFNVTPLEVSQILGIPMGEELVSEKERPRGTTVEVLAEFKGQFPDHIAKRIYLANVLGIMTSQQDSGWMFVLNFLVVFNTVFGLTLRNSTVNKRFLSCITADVDVKKFNWCEYVIRNLKREMREWDRTDAFCGPLVILAMLVAQKQSEKKNENKGLPSIKYINDKMLEALEKRIENLTSPERKSVQDKSKTENKKRKNEVEENDKNKKKLKEIKDKKVSNLKDSQDRVHSKATKEKEGFFRKKKRANIESTSEGKKKKMKKRDEGEKNVEDEGDVRKDDIVGDVGEQNFGDEGEKIDGKTDVGEKYDGEANPHELGLNKHVEFKVSEGNSSLVRNCDERIEKTVSNSKKNDEESEIVLTFGFSKITEDVNDEEIEHDEGMDKDVSFLIEKSTFLNVDVTTDFEKRLQETVDISPKATSTAEEIFEFNENQERPKRKIILSDSLRSPYVQRPVVMKAKITKIESDMAEFIFSASLTHSDTVFTTASGEVATRDTFESLYPGIEIHLSVISTWSRVLNYQENFRNKDSPSRLFLSPYPTHYRKEVTNESRMEHFQSNMESILRAENLQSIIGIDLVIIPIICDMHFYLLCFNMRTYKVELLDNIKRAQKNYKGWPNKMMRAFVDYLISTCYNGWMNFKDVKIDYVKLPWSTKKNHVDCGVFMMRHMETYFGTDVKNWDCGLSKEEDQLGELDDLRHKYVAKLLTCHINLKSASNVQEMKQYMKMNEGARKVLKETALERIQERMALHVDVQPNKDEQKD